MKIKFAILLLMICNISMAQVGLWEFDYAPDSSYMIMSKPGGEFDTLKVDSLVTVLMDAGLLDSIYRSNDTIFLRDGTGFVTLLDNDSSNELVTNVTWTNASNVITLYQPNSTPITATVTGFLESEVDGSITNEGRLTISTLAGSVLLNSNTSGNTPVVFTPQFGIDIEKFGGNEIRFNVDTTEMLTFINNNDDDLDIDPTNELDSVKINSTWLSNGDSITIADTLGTWHIANDLDLSSSNELDTLYNYDGSLLVHGGTVKTDTTLIDSLIGDIDIGIDGSGTTNYVSKFTDSTTIGDSQIFDNGTDVGIGTASPSAKLDVIGTGKYSDKLNANGNIELYDITNNNNDIEFKTNNGVANTNKISYSTTYKTLNQIVSSSTDGFDGTLTIKSTDLPYGQAGELGLVDIANFSHLGAQFPRGLYTYSGTNGTGQNIPISSSLKYGVLEIPSIPGTGTSNSYIKFPSSNSGSNLSRCWIGQEYNGNYSSYLSMYTARIGNIAYAENDVLPSYMMGEYIPNSGIVNHRIFGNTVIGATTYYDYDNTHKLKVLGDSYMDGKLSIFSTPSTSRQIYFGDYDAQITSNQGLNVYTSASGQENKIQSYATNGRIQMTIGNFDQTKFEMRGRSYPTLPNYIGFSSTTVSSDVEVGGINFTSGSAYPSATTNINGTDITLQGGANATTSGLGEYGEVVLNPNGGDVAIGKLNADAKLDIEGDLKISDRTGTATSILGADVNDKVVDLTLGGNLTLSGGVLDAVDDADTDPTNELDTLYNFDASILVHGGTVKTDTSLINTLISDSLATIVDYGDNVNLSYGGDISGKDWYKYHQDTKNFGIFLEGDNVTLDQLGNFLEINATGDGIGVGGSGTTNYLPKFTASTTLGNSIVSDDGDNLNVAGQALINGGIRLNYEIDNDTTNTIAFQIRGTTPSGSGGSYIYRQVGYNGTTGASSGALTIQGSQNSIDESIIFWVEGASPLKLRDTRVTFPLLDQNSNGGTVQSNEFAYIDSDGDLQRSDIMITDPVINFGNPDEDWIPRYTSNDQELQSSHHFRFENNNLVVYDAGNSITPRQRVTIDGGIGMRFRAVTPHLDDYLTIGSVNGLYTSHSGSIIGNTVSNLTIDGLYNPFRTMVLQGASDGLGNGIVMVTGSNKLGFHQDINGNVNMRYNANVTGELKVTDMSGATATNGVGWDSSTKQLVSTALPLTELNPVQSGTTVWLEDQNGNNVIRFTPDVSNQIEVGGADQVVLRRLHHGTQMGLVSQSLTAGNTTLNFTSVSNIAGSYITGSTSTEIISTINTFPVHFTLTGDISNSGSGCSTSLPFEIEIENNGSVVAQTKASTLMGLGQPVPFTVQELDISMTSSEDYSVNVYLPPGCTASINNVEFVAMAQ